MSKPTGYIVRPQDMKALVRKLTRPQTSLSELYEVARTLIGWAEPQQTQLPSVSVASLALPSPEADALDRIAETVRVGDLWSWSERLDEIAAILRETGRL